MNDTTIRLITYFAVAVHVGAGIFSVRRSSTFAAVPWLNLVVALCVLAYWVQKWYSYWAKGISWYASDQLVPLYALVVCALAFFTLSGRYAAVVPHWIVFAIDLLVLIAAALYFTVVRFDRMI